MTEEEKEKVDLPAPQRVGPAAQFYRDVSSGNEQGPGIVINIPNQASNNSDQSNGLFSVLNLVAIGGLLLAAVAGGTAIGAFLVDRTIESKVEDALQEEIDAYRQVIEDLERRLEAVESAQSGNP